MVQHVIGEDAGGKRNEGTKRNVGENQKHKHSKMVGPSEGGKSIRPIEWNKMKSSKHNSIGKLEKQSLDFNWILIGFNFNILLCLLNQGNVFNSK